MTETTLRPSEQVVRDFLDALAAADAPGALALVTDDLQWRHTRLPTLRGTRATGALKGMSRAGVTFAVDLHEVRDDGDRVYTRRTDHLGIGPVRQSFPVTGWFTLRDGRISIWDDHFSWVRLLGGTRLRLR